MVVFVESPRWKTGLVLCPLWRPLRRRFLQCPSTFLRISGDEVGTGARFFGRGWKSGVPGDLTSSRTGAGRRWIELPESPTSNIYVRGGVLFSGSTRHLSEIDSRCRVVYRKYLNFYPSLKNVSEVTMALSRQPTQTRAFSCVLLGLDWNVRRKFNFTILYRRWGRGESADFTSLLLDWSNQIFGFGRWDF